MSELIESLDEVISAPADTSSVWRKAQALLRDNVAMSCLAPQLEVRKPLCEFCQGHARACGEVHVSKRRCTRKRGHMGNHVACGADEKVEAHCLREWPV